MVGASSEQKVCVASVVVGAGVSSLIVTVSIAKAKLVGFASIIDRSNKKNLKIKNKIISHLKIDVPVFNKKQIPDSLKLIPITTPGSRFTK